MVVQQREIAGVIKARPVNELHRHSTALIVLADEEFQLPENLTAC